MSLTFLREKDRRSVRLLLEPLRHNVHLLLFTHSPFDQYSSLVAELLHELVSLHPRLNLEVHDLATDAAFALGVGIGKAPAIIVCDSESADFRLRFFGLPSGYIFSALLETVLITGKAAPLSVQLKTHAFLDRIYQPLHIQVFVTAADHASPAAMLLAYRLARTSPLISAEAIEVRAFPQLAEHYAVKETPTTVINEHLIIEGECSEMELVRHLQFVRL
ncbi:MAG: glutaredoxin [Chloroflexia bacterium]|nr:glutaredoxin [Chloroflexia bacterium]